LEPSAAVERGTMARVVLTDDPTVGRNCCFLFPPSPSFSLPLLPLLLVALCWRRARCGLPIFRGYCATWISGNAPPSPKSAVLRGTNRPPFSGFVSDGFFDRFDDASRAALHRSVYDGINRSPCCLRFTTFAISGTDGFTIPLLLTDSDDGLRMLLLLLLSLLLLRRGAGRNNDAILINTS